jgi:hypothetical protein
MNIADFGGLLMSKPALTDELCGLPKILEDSYVFVPKKTVLSLYMYAGHNSVRKATAITSPSARSRKSHAADGSTSCHVAAGAGSLEGWTYTPAHT